MAEEYKLKMTADTSEVVEDIKDVKEEIKKHQKSRLYSQKLLINLKMRLSL